VMAAIYFFTSQLALHFYFTDFIRNYCTQLIFPAIKLLAPLSGANLICIPYFRLSHSWVHEWWYHSWNRPVHGWYCLSIDGLIPRMGQNIANSFSNTGINLIRGNIRPSSITAETHTTEETKLQVGIEVRLRTYLFTLLF
jgi:hypothetical protein